MSRQVVNAIGQIRGPDQYLRLLTSYIGFKKEPLPYAPINRTGTPVVRPKGEAVGLARALVMDHSTHPLRVILTVGVLIAALDLVVERNVAFFVVAVMVAMIGEYVGGLSRRFRDWPSYYVREEHTSSVLLREERKNVVSD